MHLFYARVKACENPSKGQHKSTADLGQNVNICLVFLILLFLPELPEELRQGNHLSLVGVSLFLPSQSWISPFFMDSNNSSFYGL